MINRIISTNSSNEKKNNLFLTDDYVRLLRKRSLNNFTVFVTDTIHDYGAVSKYKKNYFIKKEDIDINKQWCVQPSNDHEVIIRSGNVMIRFEPYFKYTIFENNEFVKVHYYYYSANTNYNINQIKRSFYSKYKCVATDSIEPLVFVVPESMTAQLWSEMSSSDLEFAHKYKNNFLFFSDDESDALFISSCQTSIINISNNCACFNSLNFGLYLADYDLNVIDMYLLLLRERRYLDASKLLAGKCVSALATKANVYTKRIRLQTNVGAFNRAYVQR